MTKLIFRSGLRTIGGTIVEVISGKSRIIFDFGTVFGEEEKLPNVQGIYEEVSEYEDMVLISHHHLDHNKAMNLVNSNIPVVMSDESLAFLNDLYSINFEGLLGEKREYIGIANKGTIKHGDFLITSMLVDHDVLGASAFLIESEDLTLFYSGDIRLHGRKKEYTYQMIEYIKKMDKQIDVAIFEGVTISFIEEEEVIIASDKVEKYGSEQEFAQQVLDTVKEKQLLVNPYIMGLERIESIFELANQINKKVCVTSRFSYLINKYFPDYDYCILKDDEYNVGKEVIDYLEITSDYITFFDYDNKDLYPAFDEKVALLQIGGEPLGEYDSRWLELEEWGKQHNVVIYKLGVSGHASPSNLIYIINEIGAKYLIPLHSFKPELVKGKNSIQILPIQDKIYEFIKGEIKS